MMFALSTLVASWAQLESAMRSAYGFKVLSGIGGHLIDSSRSFFRLFKESRPERCTHSQSHSNHLLSPGRQTRGRCQHHLNSLQPCCTTPRSSR